MTVAISEALGAGVKAVICASTGNTAAWATAYAARAGQKAVVLILQGKVATGKLAGAIAYGAQFVQIDGSFDNALDLVVWIAQRLPIALVNSLIRIGWRGKRPVRSKSAMCWGVHQTYCACRWAMQAISQPTGWASGSTTRRSPRGYRASWACRRLDQHRWCWDIR